MLVGPKLYQVIKVIEQFGPIGTEELARITGIRRENVQTYTNRALAFGLVTKAGRINVATKRENFYFSTIEGWEMLIRKRGHGEPRVLAMPTAIKRSMPKRIINSVWALGNL